jgi:hypothetical protein
MSLDELTANEKISEKAEEEAQKTQDKIYYS